MQIITPKQKRLVGLIALIGMGSIAQFVESDRTPLYGIAAEEYLQAREPELLNERTEKPSAPILAPEEWFDAFKDKDPPPAELLALGDWPLDPRGRDSGQVAANVGSEEVGTTAADASALAHAARLGDQANAPVEALAPDETGQLEPLGPVTVSPVATLSFPKVIEKDARAPEQETGDGMIAALVAAFDASGSGKPGVAAEPQPAAQAQDGALSHGASVQTAAPHDKAQDFLKSMEWADSTVGEGIKQVVSRSRDLVGDFIAFLGLGAAEKQSTAVTKVAKQEQQPLHDEIPSVPDGMRAIALQGESEKAEVLGEERILLSAASLDDMRGGYEVNPDMRLSFGIARAVYINGNLVTTTALNLPDLAAAVGTGGGSAQITAANLGGVTLIQNGAGNTFQTTSLSPNALGTVIQNTLNNQKIQTTTTINVVANSMQLLKNIDLTRSIRDAQTLSRN